MEGGDLGWEAADLKAVADRDLGHAEIHIQLFDLEVVVVDAEVKAGLAARDSA